MKSYAIPDDLITDLVNAMILLQTSAEHHPRVDTNLHATMTYAADAMKAITDLAQAQHPVEDVVVQVVAR